MSQLWEYDVYRMNNVNEKLPEILTRFGDQGWEFIALHPQLPHVNLIFKRPKKADK